MLTRLSLRRRQFLAHAGAVLATLGVSTSVFAVEDEAQVDQTKKKRKRRNRRKRRKRQVTVLDLSEDHFEELVGQTFKVSSGRQQLKLKLVEVREHDHHTDHQVRPIHIRQEPFSLLFIAPCGGEELKSGIHEVEHPDVGEFNLFFHEVGADQNEETTHYEVVFN